MACRACVARSQSRLTGGLFYGLLGAAVLAALTAIGATLKAKPQ